MLGTFSRYFSYSHLGLQNGLNRQLPIDIGSKSNELINKRLNTVFTIIIFLAVLLVTLSIILFITRYRFSKIISIEYYFDLTLLILSILFYQFFTSYLISFSNFKLLSKVKFLFDFIFPLVSITTVFFFKVHGLILSLATIQIFASIYIAKKTNFRFTFLLERSLLFELFKTGFIIMLSSFGFYLLTTLDFLFVSSKYDFKQSGLYGFAIASVSILRVFITSISDILAPKIGFTFGESFENKNSLIHFLQDYTVFIFFIMTIISAIFYYGYPLIIKILLPEYSDSIDLIKIMIIGSILISTYIASGHILNILKKLKIVVYILVILFSISFYIFIQMDDKMQSMNYYAFVTVLMIFVYSMSIIFLSQYFLIGLKVAINSTLRIILYVAVYIILLLLIDINIFAEDIILSMLYFIIKVITFVTMMSFLMANELKSNKLFQKLINKNQ